MAANEEGDPGAHVALRFQIRLLAKRPSERSHQRWESKAGRRRVAAHYCSTRVDTCPRTHSVVGRGGGGCVCVGWFCLVDDVAQVTISLSG